MAGAAAASTYYDSSSTEWEKTAGSSTLDAVVGDPLSPDWVMPVEPPGIEAENLSVREPTTPLGVPALPSPFTQDEENGGEEGPGEGSSEVEPEPAPEPGPEPGPEPQPDPEGEPDGITNGTNDAVVLPNLGLPLIPLPSLPPSPPIPGLSPPSPQDVVPRPAPADHPPAAAAPSTGAALVAPTPAVDRSVVTAAALAVVTLGVIAAAGAQTGWFAAGWGARILFVLRRVVGLALYARLAGDRVLGHATRSDIMAFLRANPGACLTEIQDALQVGLATVRHHIGVLQTNGHVADVKSGRRRCFFAVADGLSADAREARAVLSSPSVRRVFQAIRCRPGIRQQELAAMLGVSPTSIIFHARRLEAAGVVRRSQSGRETTYHPVATAALACAVGDEPEPCSVACKPGNDCDDVPSSAAT